MQLRQLQGLPHERQLSPSLIQSFLLVFHKENPAAESCGIFHISVDLFFQDDDRTEGGEG